MAKDGQRKEYIVEIDEIVYLAPQAMKNQAGDVLDAYAEAYQLHNPRVAYLFRVLAEQERTEH